MSLVEDAAVAELQAMQNCGLGPEPLQMMQSRVQMGSSALQGSGTVHV